MCSTTSRNCEKNHQFISLKIWILIFLFLGRILVLKCIFCGFFFLVVLFFLFFFNLMCFLPFSKVPT